MTDQKVLVHWPNGVTSYCHKQDCILDAAKSADVSIPFGCLRGSCGSCEIEVNGLTVRACITQFSIFDQSELVVDYFQDYIW